MNWNKIKSEVEYAITTGITLEDFLLSKDMDRNQWYAMKPKGWKWNKIQREENSKSSSPEDEKAMKLCCINTICENSVASKSDICMTCTNFALKNLLMMYRKGFTDKIIKNLLG